MYSYSFMAIHIILFCFILPHFCYNSFIPTGGLYSLENTYNSIHFTSLLAVTSPSEFETTQLRDNNNDNNINSWEDVLDGVQIITTTAVDEEGTRLQRTLNEIDIVGLGQSNVPISINTFVPDDEDRVRGCYSSHIAVMRKIIEENVSKDDFRILILEDNLERTESDGLDQVLTSLSSFFQQKSDYGDWDIFHLAYMMYVPGLQLNRVNEEEEEKAGVMMKDWYDSVVRMRCTEASAVGTSAYIVSRSGAEKMIAYDNNNGYTEAVPNIMAKLFPESRYAAYPMIFHRASKVGSLVNPQLDDFRKVMFTKPFYKTWERLMVGTGWGNEKILPLVLGTITLSSLAVVASGVSQILPEGKFDTIANILAAGPLAVFFWGISLFGSGAGFAPSARVKNE